MLLILTLILGLLISSCHDSLGKDSSAPIASAILPAKAFECTYIKNKQKCKEIYSEIKRHYSSEEEKRFIHFIGDSLLPCWYGTKWNFYGTTETPGEGTIACGYFVTTVIRDSGIPIQRIKMAQCASEEMIKKTCIKESIQRYSNTEMQFILDRIKETGFGLYIIGLDNHTGFILNDGKGIYFIHSTFITPGCVIKEDADKSTILKQSKYKVIGKIKI